MRYCIVNGDDFGASGGINRGILEAHERGILTSTSLLVDMPASGEAAAAARRCPALSVGVHFDLTGESELVVRCQDIPAIQKDLVRQLDRFIDLVGGLPTHLDTHHNVHRQADLLPCFLEIAAQYGLPLREHSTVRYFPSFYGQWDGETHLEQISTECLLRMLENDFASGITELSCHPGYVDSSFASVYGIEREAELRTLCDPAVRARLGELGIRLIGFRDIPGIPKAAP